MQGKCSECKLADDVQDGKCAICRTFSAADKLNYMRQRKRLLAKLAELEMASVMHATAPADAAIRKRLLYARNAIKRELLK